MKDVSRNGSAPALPRFDWSLALSEPVAPACLAGLLREAAALVESGELVRLSVHVRGYGLRMGPRLPEPAPQGEGPMIEDSVAKEALLSPSEVQIVNALTGVVLYGKQIARCLGRDYDSDPELKLLLRNLVSRGVLTHERGKGYALKHRPPTAKKPASTEAGRGEQNGSGRP